jgi:putative phage-type endonuclease
MIFIDTEAWLEGRTYGIGGSEAGIILGINPFKSRLELWNEKVTRTRHLHPEAEIRLKLGNLLESFIAEEYSKITNRKLDVRDQMVHPKYNFILGNIDREIIDNEKGPGVLEIKTKGAFTNWEGEDIPIYYMAQLQHYLELYNYKWGSFAILDLGTLKINHYDVNRDDEFIDKLIKEEVAFWDLVEKKIPPEVNGSGACQEFLKEYYSVSKPEMETIDLSNSKEAKKWAAMLRDAKRNIKAFGSIELESKNHLMSIMGHVEKATGPGFSITWRAPKDREIFDVEKFKIDHPDIYKKYIKNEPQSRRFMVRFM